MHTYSCRSPGFGLWHGRRRFATGGTLLGLLLIFACSQAHKPRLAREAHPDELPYPQQGETNFSATVGVTRFHAEAGSMQGLSPGQVESLSAMLADKIVKTLLQQDISAVVLLEEGAIRTRFVVEGTFEKITPGSRFGKLTLGFLGIPAGAARVEATVKIMDAGGQTVNEARISGRSGLGGLSSDDAVLEKAADDFAHWAASHIKAVVYH